MLQDIEPVGRYALQFKWSDGHDTGIYAYKLLRGLCQCDLCQPVKPNGAEKPEALVRCRYGPLAAALIAVGWARPVMSGCIGMPPIAEQERKIQKQ